MKNGLEKSPKSHGIRDSMQGRCALRYGLVEDGKDAGSKGDPMPEGGPSKPAYDSQQVLPGLTDEHSLAQTSNLDSSGVHDEVGAAAKRASKTPSENERRCA